MSLVTFEHDRLSEAPMPRRLNLVHAAVVWLLDFVQAMVQPWRTLSAKELNLPDARLCYRLPDARRLCWRRSVGPRC